jgi:adenosylcobinamide kinase / adenosylcobinamide-phosphate guanylyltransferase
VKQKSVTLVLGGVRSGKSRFAVQQALREDSVVFIATARASDGEMAAKIRRHREERPSSWATIEEPLKIASVITEHSGRSCLLVDCLTLFAANLMESCGDNVSKIDAEIDRLGAAIQAAESSIILVTNEVGSGVVPGFASGRQFRDLLGDVNQRMAAISTRVVLMVAGVPMIIKGEGARSGMDVA